MAGRPTLAGRRVSVRASACREGVAHLPVFLARPKVHQETAGAPQAHQAHQAHQVHRETVAANQEEVRLGRLDLDADTHERGEASRRHGHKPEQRAAELTRCVRQPREKKKKKNEPCQLGGGRHPGGGPMLGFQPGGMLGGGILPGGGMLGGMLEGPGGPGGPGGPMLPILAPGGMFDGGPMLGCHPGGGPMLGFQPGGGPGGRMPPGNSGGGIPGTAIGTAQRGAPDTSAKTLREANPTPLNVLIIGIGPLPIPPMACMVAKARACCSLSISS